MTSLLKIESVTNVLMYKQRVATGKVLLSSIDKDEFAHFEYRQSFVPNGVTPK